MPKRMKSSKKPVKVAAAGNGLKSTKRKKPKKKMS
jgi:hypothetical protein